MDVLINNNQSDESTSSASNNISNNNNNNNNNTNNNFSLGLASSSSSSSSSSSASSSLMEPPTPPPSLSCMIAAAASESAASETLNATNGDSNSDNLITLESLTNESKFFKINNENNNAKRTNNNNNKSSNAKKSKHTNDETNNNNNINNNNLENKKVYCICRKAEDEDDDENEDEEDMMINCEVCDDWLHGKCVNLNHRLAADIEKYVCPRCISDQNQIVYKTRQNYHRHDYSDAHAQRKPVQAGTPVFIENLLKRTFPDALQHKIVKKIEQTSTQLSMSYFKENGFAQPLLIENKNGLDFIMPSSAEINLSQIEDIVGGEYLIDVIDVERQITFPMSINELNNYFQQENRTKVYNLISFEISKTKLTKNITAPRIVHDLSWISNGIWPSDENHENDAYSNNNDQKQQHQTITTNVVKPEVQKYCLISAAKSYTDFHIDFGGSSVWYHTVKGDKIFYLIEPTDENLSIYEKWASSKNQSEIFLGDKVSKCYKFEIKAGNTILLPSGWIHAVYTPHDSLVFGGNFLQSFSIPLQIKVYEIERRCLTPEKFRFPAFETLQWFAAKHFASKLKKSNEKMKSLKANFLSDLKYLHNTLKRWTNSKEFYEQHEYYVPRRINYEKLLRTLNKELTKAEVMRNKILLKTSSRSNVVMKETSFSSLSVEIKQETINNNSNSKMFIDGNDDNDSSKEEPESLSLPSTTKNTENNNNEQKTADQQQPEVVCFKNMDQLEEVRFDDDVAEDEEELEKNYKKYQQQQQQQQIESKEETSNGGGIRLVMKLPKEINKEQQQQKTNDDHQKPLKIKLKLTSTTTTTTTTTSNSNQTPENNNNIYKNHHHHHNRDRSHSKKYSSTTSSKPNEDDELIKDLKNAYYDDDFVYPSLSEHSKSSNSSKLRNSSSTNETEQQQQQTPDGRPIRKRKLKPHAVEYLLPKQTNNPQEDELKLDDLNQKQQQQEQQSKPKKPKNILDAMIEKNLKQQAKLEEKNKQLTTTKKAKKEKSGINNLTTTTKKQQSKLDNDYTEGCEDEEDDEDIDFKINCKQNLKLSKKLKKTSAKLHKEQLTDSPNTLNSSSSNHLKDQKSASSSSAAASNNNQQQHQQQHQKKFKKGFATAKQRLGKLLKLNRVVNI